MLITIYLCFHAAIYLKTAAIRRLGFSETQNFAFFKVLRANLRHHAKFHQNRLERCGDVVFKMAAVRNLGLIRRIYSIIGITHEEHLVVFTVVQNLAGIDSLI